MVDEADEKLEVRTIANPGAEGLQFDRRIGGKVRSLTGYPVPFMGYDSNVAVVTRRDSHGSFHSVSRRMHLCISWSRRSGATAGPGHDASAVRTWCGIKRPILGHRRFPDALKAPAFSCTFQSARLLHRPNNFLTESWNTCGAMSKKALKRAARPSGHAEPVREAPAPTRSRAYGSFA